MVINRSKNESLIGIPLYIVKVEIFDLTDLAAEVTS